VAARDVGAKMGPIRNHRDDDAYDDDEICNALPFTKSINKFF
jgi:hypothetical protein